MSVNNFDYFFGSKHFRLLPLLFLFFLGLISIAANLWNMRNNAHEMAAHYAEGMVQLVSNARLWNAEYGEIYVPVNENTPPNPFLDAPNRDLITQEGLELTMVNPAYMTRQIAEITRRQEGAVLHLTSTAPLNPVNAADKWEQTVLADLELGDKSSRFELLSTPEGKVYRYLEPLYIEPPCLRCHADQGYEEGDLRGGISLTFPAEPHLNILSSQINWMLAGHGIAFLLVSSVVLTLLNRLQRQREAAAKYALELERSNKELQDFAHIVSHDLQEPLRTIVSFGDRLQHKYGDGLDERGHEYLLYMQKAAIRMRQLIEDLLDYSRVTSKKLSPAPVNLNEVVQEVITDLEELIRERNGRVVVENLPTVNVDRGQIHRLLLNLIGNALKFQAEGVSPLVRLVGAIYDRKVEIQVIDNGIGFDEKYLDRIFRPFQRLHGRNQYRGTGMGLAICKKIVEGHHGELTARSRPGEGTSFRIILPF